MVFLREFLVIFIGSMVFIAVFVGCRGQKRPTPYVPDLWNENNPHAFCMFFEC